MWSTKTTPVTVVTVVVTMVGRLVGEGGVEVGRKRDQGFIGVTEIGVSDECNLV